MDVNFVLINTFRYRKTYVHKIFPIFGQSLINENCHNSRASNDIDMKLGPEPNYNKRNTEKNLKVTLCQQIVGHCYFSDLWPI